jgi:hypothetical protein
VTRPLFLRAFFCPDFGRVRTRVATAARDPYRMGEFMQ